MNASEQNTPYPEKGSSKLSPSCEYFSINSFRLLDGFFPNIYAFHICLSSASSPIIISFKDN